MWAWLARRTRSSGGSLPSGVDLALEALEERFAGVPAAESVVEFHEQIDRRPEARHVRHTDAYAARGLLVRQATGIDEPPQ